MGSRRWMAVALVAALGFCAAGARAGDREYVLRWLPPTGGSVSGYRVQVADEPRSTSETFDIGWVAPDAEGIGRYPLILAAEVGHFVTMTSYNGAGESVRSNELFVPASACDPSACDDGNPCTADDCGTEGCSHTAVADQTFCGPSGEICLAGVCQATECTADVDCQDGDLCDGAERCVGFECTEGAPLACGEPTECQAPMCDAELGCQMVPLGDGTPCDDGSSQTRKDSCQGGYCVGFAKANKGRGKPR